MFIRVLQEQTNLENENIRAGFSCPHAGFNHTRPMLISNVFITTPMNLKTSNMVESIQVFQYGPYVLLLIN